LRSNVRRNWLRTTEAFARPPKPRSGKIGRSFIQQYPKCNARALENIHEFFDMEQMGLKPTLKRLTGEKSMCIGRLLIGKSFSI
jgi:hypothetical protein